MTLALGLSACSAITGRPFVEWSDDKAISVDHVTVHAMPA